MKKIILLLFAVVLSLKVFSQANPGLGDVSTPGTFYDTFDEPILDSGKWSIGNQKWGTDNGGIVPENVALSNGNLVIEGHGNQYTGPVQGHGQNTKVGGGIISKPKFGAGVYEVRAKICPQLGALSAFWTFEYGKDGQEGYSEIDFEMPAFKTPGEPSFEYLFCNNWETETKYESVAAKVSPLNDGQYHTFRFEWYPASMTATPHVDYYLDGKLLTYITNYVPNFDAQCWIAIWFPTWAGTPNFEVDHMYVDWFKFTPATTDPGLPGTVGESAFLWANFNGAENYAYAGGDFEEGGTSTSTTSFVNATDTGNILKWEYSIKPNTIGYSYAYSLVNKDALTSETGVNSLGTRYIKFWVKPEGDIIGKSILLNLNKGRDRSRYGTPVLAAGWNEIEIPILKDSVTSIAFVVASDGVTTTSGTLYIDDIKFKDVSARDGGTIPPDGDIAPNCSVPAQPDQINGDTAVQAGFAQIYSVPAVTGATSYTWTLPAGWTGTSNSNSISATAGNTGGTISVTAINSCGMSIPRSISVTVFTVPVNLAEGKKAFASSSAANSNPALALDGNLNTRWSSASNCPSWIYVDLGESYSLGKVEVSWANGAHGRDYKIQTSKDAKTWVTKVNVRRNSSLSVTYTLSARGRYVRLVCTKSGTNRPVAIRELKVYQQFTTIAANRQTEEASVEIYPNPASTQLNIKLGGKLLHKGSVSIYNSLGKLLFTSEMAGSHLTFDVSMLPKGFYYIVLSDGKLKESYRFFKE